HHPRMRAKLVIEPLVASFAEQIKVVVGQDRRKAIGIFDLDDIVAISRAKLVALRAVRHRARKQPGIMDTHELRGLSMLADGLDIGCVGQEGAHHRLLALLVDAKVAEGIGVAAFDDRIGLGGQLIHRASLADSDRMRSRPASGVRSHSGRSASSYSISRTAFSSKKKLTIASAACGSAGHSRALVMLSR